MSNASKFRKKAVEYEQLKQFDRAVASYVRAIEENENANEEVDVALFNKVGDLTLRQGRVTEAVTYYERAVEHYVSNNLFDNAIALCNKILRNAPGRSNVYYTLGRICGRKGLRSDATRNFLEYATRMQQEGRVDEGMRALAEVADLMPELTEVGRLVEEHAARAGISLAPRRRATPPRTEAQPATEQTRSFGLSKDLVFLQIDYEAAQQARAKTPPPQRYIVDETPANGVNAAKELTPVQSVAASSTVDSSFVSETPVVTPTATTVAVVTPTPESRTARLEDLMIFDPNERTPAHAEAFGSDDSSVVDGSPILKPYVELTEPVELLNDLQPTELTAAVATEVDAEFASTVVDVVDGVSNDESREPERHETPVAMAPVPATPEFVAVVEDNAAQSNEALAEEDNAGIYGNVTMVDEAIEPSAPAAELDEPEIAVILEPESAEPTTVESFPALETIELQSVEDTSIELLDDVHSGTESETASDDNAEIGEIVNFAAEQEFNLAAPAPLLDGFTPDDEPLALEEFEAPHAVADDFIVESELGTVVETVNDTVSDSAAESFDLLSSLDFDAMLDVESEIVQQVPDLLAEEFEIADDELAASRFARIESETLPELPDEFDNENELPPLNVSPSDSDDASVLAVEVATPDLEFIDLDVELEVPRGIDLGIVHEVAFDVHSGVELGAGIDLELTPESLEIEPLSVEIEPLSVDIDPASVEIEPISVEIEPIAAELDADVLDADMLDDLFIDSDVPTAVVAAEATLVASSRCAELQTASDADPNNFVLRRRLAEALLESGERDAAFAELGAALAIAELAGNLADAADVADELVRVAADQVAHHQKRLELAIRLGDQGRLRGAYLDFADALVRQGEELRARAVYARVLEIDPWDDRARTALGDAAPPPPPKPAAPGSDESHVNLADWLKDDDEPVSTRLRMREPDISGDEQEDFNSLLKQFKEGVARSLGEDDYESHYDLGVAYKEMGLLDDAIGEFQKALRSRSNRLAAYEALGQCFLEQQSYKVAVTVLSRALHEPAIEDEQRVGVLYLLGYSCEVLQRFDEARGYFQRVYATDIHFRDVAQRLAALDRTVR